MNKFEFPKLEIDKQVKSWEPNEPIGVSKKLDSFLTFLRTTTSLVDRAKSVLSITDAVTQDALHDFESGKLNYDERAKMATQLQICRQTRRKAKDVIEDLEPLIAWCEENKQPIFKLQEALGQIRKREHAHQNRVYSPRFNSDLIPNEKQQL